MSLPPKQFTDDMAGRADAYRPASETVAYYGFAQFGCQGTNKTGWAIMRVTTRPDGVTIKEWAAGNQDTNKIFDDYASYNYSLLK